jgi:glycosyltransferase involved in cell wall biosynthesis
MSDQLSPKITVIIAVYNGVQTLQQCIDSFTSQTYANKELIIIDGASTDGSIEIIKKNQKDINYWVSEPDKGIYNAWNKGLERVNGEWVCFLGADDFFWENNVLERMGKQLIKLPESIRVAYGQVMLLNTNAKPLYLIGEPWDKAKKCFKQKMSLPHQGVMHRRSLFEMHGKFDESFRIVGDYELLLRELKTGDAAFISDIIVTGMRQGGVSSNPKQSLRILWEVRFAQRKHGQMLPGWIWLFALVRVYIRLLLWKILGESLTRKALDVGRRMMGLPAYWTKL